ncbi:MAG: subfamily B ATP-binding cassette protein MsbA [Mariniblastus sp.]|jgi:subfamily B ATP-binding cassette protein MsbA
MKPFFQAVKHSLRYRWTIAGAFVCSLLIAVIWSASITTVFPIVKIVLEGETAITWVEHEIESGERNIDLLKQEIDSLETQQTQAPNATLLNKIDLKSDRLKGEQEALAWYKNAQPYVDEYAPQSAFLTLVVALSWLLGVSVVKGILLIISAILDARVSERTVLDLRRIYYRKALELDQRRIDFIGTSAMMTHLSYNMTMISSGLRMFYGKCLREPLKMIACLAVAAWISLPLLIISLAIVPAGAFLIHSISRRMKRSTQIEMAGMAEVFQTLIETFKAVKTVRIFNRERTERRRFKGNASTLYQMQLRIALYDSLLRPITEVLSIISISLSMLVGSYLVLNQQTHLFEYIKISDTPIKPAMLLVFYAMLAGAADPARKMSEIINVIVRGGTACENLFRTFGPAPLIAAPENPIPVPVHQESIHFENVIFGYLPRQPVLRKVDLKIPYGQTLAIVGGNGSGKSTLMNLLARFYDPHAGFVRIDGQDIRQMQPKKVRQQISWVTQDSVLFNGTLWENIAYGRSGATDEEIMHAIRIARIDDFVDKLVDGYHANVGDDGKKLSAGQRQRVAIARAVVSNPKILILDEATSQIDGQSEAIIHNSLAKFIKGRTTIVITHRASSLRLADRVIVMDVGRIVHDSSVENATEHSLQFQQLFAKSA